MNFYTNRNLGKDQSHILWNGTYVFVYSFLVCRVDSEADSRNQFLFVCCCLPFSGSLTPKSIYSLLRHPLCFRLVWVGSYLSKLTQTCPNQFKLVQTCPNWFKLVQTCLNLSKLVQIWSNYLNCSNLSKLAQSC